MSKLRLGEIKELAHDAIGRYNQLQHLNLELSDFKLLAPYHATEVQSHSSSCIMLTSCLL